MTSTDPATDPDFAPDCANCAALCCVALAFDEGPDFAHDKPAGVACRHLSEFRCAIHDRLAEAGYAGCARYDCLGAGQRATALFARTWRKDPGVMAAMMRAFATMRRVQALRQLLRAAATLALSPSREGERRDWLARLDGVCGSEADLARFEAENTDTEARRWLRGLAHDIA